jgi:hypothetical protein
MRQIGLMGEVFSRSFCLGRYEQTGNRFCPRGVVVELARTHANSGEVARTRVNFLTERKWKMTAKSLSNMGNGRTRANWLELFDQILR